MKNSFARLCQVMALTLLACFCLSVLAVAEDNAPTMNSGGRFVVIPQKPASRYKEPAGTLQEWNGSFTYNGTNYPFVMVGRILRPDQGTVITTLIVPVKIVLSDGSRL